MPIYSSNFTFSNSSSFDVWMTGVNALTGNWLGVLILVVVWVSILVTLKYNPWTRLSDAFAVASFVTWIAASLFLAFEFVSITVWAVTLSLLILGGLWLWLEPGA